MDLSKLSKVPNYNKAYGEYTSYLGKTKAPIDYYNEATNTLGIPDARSKVAADRKAISDTQSLVDAVDPSVTGRTQGSLVTEAQRQGLVTKEKTPLLESLGRLAGIYGTSSGNLSDLMGQAQLQADYGMAGQNNNLAALQFRVQRAWEDEQAKRAAAAEAQNNAWIEALLAKNQEQQNRVNDLQQGGNDVRLSLADMSRRLSVQPNYGMQGSTYNPQQTIPGIALQGSRYNPQATYSPQKAYSGNINTLRTSSPLRVASPSNTNRNVTVNNSKRKRNISVSPRKNNYNVVVR